MAQIMKQINFTGALGNSEQKKDTNVGTVLFNSIHTFFQLNSFTSPSRNMDWLLVEQAFVISDRKLSAKAFIA